MPGRLTDHRYGKHRVRVSKVRRPREEAPGDELHEFVEATVAVELGGDFDAAFTDADNRSVVATDTCKNTIYALAKDHPLDAIESFGLAIAQHFLDRYEQVDFCEVTLDERLWRRLLGSSHAFVASDTMTPTAKVDARRGVSPRVTAGLERLLIAKTTESGFADFHRDEFRTLADTNDRILATEVSASWRYATATVDFVEARRVTLDALLGAFMDHYSNSVQETLYRMGQATLAACAEIEQITLSLPNKHHLLADLSPFGRENDNEVFVVTDEPFGYITGTLARE